MDPQATECSQSGKALQEELGKLRARLVAAEAVIAALSLEPVVKMTGQRKKAFEAWKLLAS